MVTTYPVPPIERYLADVFAPELRKFGVGSEAAKVVTADVRDRLVSILSRWDDEAFRRTVLLLGLEEATFYKPRWAPIEIRALVVAAVRDSLLEDLNATQASRPELQPFTGAISNEHVPDVTRPAVEFFAHAKLDAGPLPPVPPAESDVFGALAVNYPRAWSALSILAAMPAPETAYRLADQDAPIPELPKTSPQRGSPRSSSVVANGITPEIDSALWGLLTDAVRQGAAFVSDSFKMLSRNPVKLLLVIEYLLAHGLPFVTFNLQLLHRPRLPRAEGAAPSARAGHDGEERVRDRGEVSQHGRALRPASRRAPSGCRGGVGRCERRHREMWHQGW